MSGTRETIIMVDDNLTNLTVGKNMLRTFYQIITVPSAAKMFEALENASPALILLDIDMPDMNGYEAIKILKADGRFLHIPVIFLTAMDDEDSELEGFNLGASDYIAKPFSTPLLLKRIEKELLIVRQKRDLLNAQIELHRHMLTLESRIQEKAGEITHLHNAVFSAIVDLVEFRDKYTGGHVERTRLYLKALIDEMLASGVYADEIRGWNMESVLASARFHDVGKIAVPDSILRKPGKLTPEEFEQMKLHVEAGVDAVERIIGNTEEKGFLNHALHITGTHHEKWNGSGYPIGLKGRNIPLEGRLMAIADVYDALISVRPYKEALAHEEACRIIEEGSGLHFDPALVDVFIKIEKVFRQISSEVSG